MPKANRQEVFQKIAEAALELHQLGSNVPVSKNVALALRQHLATLIDSGVHDNQRLLDEGIAFLRRQETKKLR